jgi:predicted DNA-binding transcriptional regulator YafY
MEKDTSRLSRLTAILIQLQTKRLLTATEMSTVFKVSVRTIYRDIRALEEAGVPILTEEGKGYSLMEGYRIPPVMFTEDEANALITAELLIIKNKDASFVKHYSGAITKIKSVLKYATKEKVDLLSKRVLFGHPIEHIRTSDYLAIIQSALTNFNVIRLDYQSPKDAENTMRFVEPFALYNSLEENWMLVAWCRLRQDFRVFRLDRILKMNVLDEKFEKHKITFQDYIDQRKKNRNSQTPLT